MSPAPSNPSPARVKQPGGNVDDYGKIKTKDDVPEHYRDDSRFDALSQDPDHKGKVTDKSVKEAMTELEAEQQGIMQSPIEPGPKGIEFYDGSGSPYDVKTLPSPGTGARFKFKPEQSGQSILKQVRQKFPNKQSGDPEAVKVLLDSTYMTPEDHKSLWEYLNKHASPEELKLIEELTVRSKK